MALSKADIFEAKVSNAFDEASSDSDEVFIYESDPPESYDEGSRFDRGRRHHYRNHIHTGKHLISRRPNTPRPARPSPPRKALLFNSKERESYSMERPTRVSRGSMQFSISSSIPREVVLLGPMRKLGTMLGFCEQPVQPGYLRLKWSCKCGRRYHQDIDQRLIDMSTFASIVQSATSNWTGPSDPRCSESFIYLPRTPITPQNLPVTPSTSLASHSQSSATGFQVDTYDSGSTGRHGVSTNDQITRKREQNIGELDQPRKEGEEKGPVPRWIIVCVINRCVRSYEHINAIKARDDLDLFRDIKKYYIKLRPKWRRLRELRDVHNIRLVKFQLRHVQMGKEVLKFPSICDKWEPPDKNSEPNWEYDSQDIGIESLPQFMMCLWHLTEEGNHGPTDNQLQFDTSYKLNEYMDRGEGLPTEENPTKSREKSNSRCWHVISLKFFSSSRMPQPDPISWESSSFSTFRAWWSSCRQSFSMLLERWPFVQLFPPAVESSSQGPSADSHTDLLSTLGVEAELSLNDSFWVFNETPRRIHTMLDMDRSCKKPPTGWAILIEEDFIIPWYALLIFHLVPAACLAVAVALSVHHGLTWISVASYCLSFATFIFTQWISKTKDSKR